ncbi:transcription initiation factor TFIID subunit 12-like [Argopecten irradians]|uniref:transcription initiation factor TFIID subunit 12-like n=1 Tax=Argopecten irradians TaxID=31199 RepID=UPI00371792A3
MHSALSVTLQLISTGYLDNCLPTTTVATTSTSPTTTTVPTTTATSTSLSTTTTGECDSTFGTTDPSAQQNCRCILRKPMVNLTTSQLQTIVTELQSQLSVNKSTLSSTIRKKTSATDNRPSSRVIGMAGAVFLALPFVLLITCDIIRLFSHRRQTVLVI